MVSFIIGWFKMESTIRWSEVAEAARGQVVDHEYGFPRLEQALHQV
jgi:hypothetical protein